MKKLILVLILTLTLSSLFSCGKSEEVSVLYYTYSDTYISSVRGAVGRALDRLRIGYHGYDAAGNQTTQTEQVDTAITKGTRLLAVNVVDTGSEDAAKAIIEKAKAADLPIIFFNPKRPPSYAPW